MGDAVENIKKNLKKTEELVSFCIFIDYFVNNNLLKINEAKLFSKITQ